MYPMKRGMLWNTASSAAMCLGGIAARIWAFRLGQTRIVNHAIYKKVVQDRAMGTPLITVSNHRSVVDDCLLWPIVSSYGEVLRGRMRWVLGAEEVMFWSKAIARLSALVRIIPVRRGHGVYQRCMNECIRLLKEGEWVHIYPEGKIIETEEEEVRLKWGIGRLVADMEAVPLVVPVWHVGLDDLVPNIRPYRPHFGQRVTVVFGEPMDFRPLLHKLRQRSADARTVRKQITDVIQLHFRALQKKSLAEHDSWS